MMREWATVISWHDGVAILHSETKTSCNRCSARKGCGSHLLNQIGPKNAHIIEIRCQNPLQPGQRVELGIGEKNLLGSAMLVYMAPLVSLFVIASVFYILLDTDLAAITGALLGGIGGFLVAKSLVAHISSRSDFQPVILTVALPLHHVVHPENKES